MFSRHFLSTSLTILLIGMLILPGAAPAAAERGMPVPPDRQFDLADDDPPLPLPPTPDLQWNTFLGGNLYWDEGYDIAVDGSGNCYVVGTSDITWGSPVRPYSGSSQDAFVAKLSSSGSLLWNTFLGGGGWTDGYGIALDSNGYVYVVGDSLSTWGSPKRPHATGYEDGFAAKLGPSGNLIWNTFLGGSGGDGSYGVAVDGSGNINVVGDSDATWGSPKHPYSSGYDAFAAKLDSSGNLLWNTFMGGYGWDTGENITTDNTGYIYVTGFSAATWGNPKRFYTGGQDAFTAKLNSSGSLLWNTFLGGNDDDGCHDIAVDGSGNAYVAGTSYASWGNPVHPFTAYDAFAAKLNTSGALSWNTFVGGSGGEESGYGIALGKNRSVYLVGQSSATWGSPKRPFTGSNDAFVVKLVNVQSVTYRSVGTYDGWILESSETSGKGGTMDSTSNLLYVGDNANDKQYRLILSFNTASLPDNAGIYSVILKLKLQGMAGTNPFITLGNLVLDVKKGSFNGNPVLQVTDFQAAASKSNVGQIFDLPDNGWYSKVWTSGVNQYINKTGVTQFRLRFPLDDDNDNIADYLKFYSGSANTSYRPQLIVKYYLP